MRYIFIVDTDKYAGNFERPLVAYMTGQINIESYRLVQQKTIEESEYV